MQLVLWLNDAGSIGKNDLVVLFRQDALMRCRVVCTFGETIASFSPINALSKVLLPALGRPKILRNLLSLICAKVHCKYREVISKRITSDENWSTASLSQIA